jgi:hypothetical protein
MKIAIPGLFPWLCQQIYYSRLYLPGALQFRRAGTLAAPAGSLEKEDQIKWG